MKNDSVNYVLVGTFVIAMLFALLFAIALLTGRTGSTDTYFTRYLDATGLKYGSQVMYMGFPVGQVEDIRPVVDKGQVVFDVEMSLTEELRSWNVPQDSVAEVRASGLLAAVAIDIRAGTSAQSLQPGARIEGRGQTNLFGAVNETAHALHELTLTGVKPLLQNLNLHLNRFGEMLDSKAGPLVENLGALVDELARRAPDIIDDFLQTTEQLRAVSASLNQLLGDDNVRKVGSVVDNVLLASENLAGLADSARGQLDTLLGPAMLSRVDRFVGDAAETASEALALSRGARTRIERALSDDNLSSVERTVANLETASQGMAALVGEENRARVNRSLSAVEAASHQARLLLDEDTRRAVDETLANVHGASETLEAMIADTRAQLGELIGPGTRRRLDQVLDNVSRASANIAQLSTALEQRVGEVLTPETSSKLRHSLDNFSKAAGSIAELGAGLLGTRRRLDALLENLDQATSENRPGVRDSVRALRHTLRTISQNIDSVTNNLEGTSRNLFELSRRLKGNPGLLLRSPVADDETVTTRGGG